MLLVSGKDQKFLMISTISEPMRFWDSTVAARMCRALRKCAGGTFLAADRSSYAARTPDIGEKRRGYRSILLLLAEQKNQKLLMMSTISAPMRF